MLNKKNINTNNYCSPYILLDPNTMRAIAHPCADNKHNHGLDNEIFRMIHRQQAYLLHVHDTDMKATLNSF